MRTTRKLGKLAVVALLVAASTVAGTGAAGAAGSTATGKAPALALPLSVQGNRVVDANGSTVVLRGLQRDGTQGGSGVSRVPVTAAELGWMGFQQPGSWHATVVRVPLGSAQWTGACPNLANDPATYKAAVDAEVQALTSQGIVTLLDLHSSTAGCTSIARHAMPDAPVSQQFWADVATRYRSNALVAFELYNEPHYITDATWLEGSAGATVQDCDLTAPWLASPAERLQQQAALARCQAAAPKYKAAGMQELYDLVMTKAPGHLVVVDGNGWATSPSTRPVNAWAGGLVHGLHPYACASPGAACNTTSNALANVRLLDTWLSPARSAPVLVTEMGWPVYPKSDGTGYVDGARYYRETLEYVQRQSPPWGFVAFAMDGSWKSAFSLISSTTTYAPNSTGQPVYDLLRAS
jgi:hypothetical protein